MQFVIRVDLDQGVPSLNEILEVALKSGWNDDTLRFPETGNAGDLEDVTSRVTGTWEIEEGSTADYSLHPLTRDYRQAATARYGKPGEVEVNRFAPVSIADDGAFVQGWLFVPEAEVRSDGRDMTHSPSKPPRSVGLSSVPKTKSA